MHGLKLVIKEDVLPQEQLPQFPAVERLAEKGLLAVDTWNSKREIVNFKATIEIPMLGSTIENSGDALDESHMPLGWPLSIDGAVRQNCSHKKATIQELDNMLQEFDLRRSSVAINRNATQWSHNSVWNKKYMEPIQGYTLKQLWKDAEPYISKKTSRSSDVSEGALLRNVRELNSLPRASRPDTRFLQELGNPSGGGIPRQNATLMQRAVEEWERTVCENKAVAILDQLQKDCPTLIQPDGGAMLIAIVLDKPLPEAQALVDNPHAFLQEISQVLADQRMHPILEHMLSTIQGDTAKQSTDSASSSDARRPVGDDQFQ